jgi:hypothetical protein
MSMLTLVALNHNMHEMKTSQEQGRRACIHSNTTFTVSREREFAAFDFVTLNIKTALDFSVFI